MEILRKYSSPEIKGEIQRYILLCEKAKDILDHYLDPGDFFYHPELGINTVEKNRGDGRFYCDEPEFSMFEIETKECIWLPSVKQLEDMAIEIDMTSSLFTEFLNDNKGYFGYPAGRKPKYIFITLEEQRLAYYLFSLYKHVWSDDKKEWIKVC